MHGQSRYRICVSLLANRYGVGGFARRFSVSAVSYARPELAMQASYVPLSFCLSLTANMESSYDAISLAVSERCGSCRRQLLGLDRHERERL